MSKTKKYDFRLTQENNYWSVEITRRVSSAKTIVSKRQDGFVTEAEAQAWGTSEVETFLQNYKEKEKQRSKERALAKSDRDQQAKQRPTRTAKSPWDR